MGPAAELARRLAQNAEAVCREYLSNGRRESGTWRVGDIDNTPEAVRRLVHKLASRHGELLFCYEAGPTGYGLQRQIATLGHDCAVIAPSLICRSCFSASILTA